MDFFNGIFYNLALLEFYFLTIIYILLYIDFILSIFFQHSNMLTRASHHWCLASNIVLVVYLLLFHLPLLSFRGPVRFHYWGLIHCGYRNYSQYFTLGDSLPTSPPEYISTPSARNRWGGWSISYAQHGWQEVYALHWGFYLRGTAHGGHRAAWCATCLPQWHHATRLLTSGRDCCTSDPTCCPQRPESMVGTKLFQSRAISW